MLDECRLLGGCNTGEAKITGAGNLQARHVIHAVGPVWRGGDEGEAEALASCYEQSLTLAAEHECRTVAFPAISTGIYAYPLDEAAEVSVKARCERGWKPPEASKRRASGSSASAYWRSGRLAAIACRLRTTARNRSS